MLLYLITINYYASREKGINCGIKVYIYIYIYIYKQTVIVCGLLGKNWLWLKALVV